MHLGRHVKRSEVVPAPSRRSVNGSCHHHDPRSGSSARRERRFSRKPCEKEGRQAWCSGSLLLRNRPARTWTLEKATGILRICVSVGRLGSAGRFCSRSHLGSLMHLLPDAARGCNRRTAGPLSTPSCSLRASPRSAAGTGTSRAARRGRPGAARRPPRPPWRAQQAVRMRGYDVRSRPHPQRRPCSSHAPRSGHTARNRRRQACVLATSVCSHALVPRAPSSGLDFHVPGGGPETFFSPPKIVFFFFFCYIPVVLKPESTLP